MEAQHKLLNQYFPNDSFMMLRNHISKRLIQTTDRLMEFDVTELISYSTL